MRTIISLIILTAATICNADIRQETLGVTLVVARDTDRLRDGTDRLQLALGTDRLQNQFSCEAAIAQTFPELATSEVVSQCEGILRVAYKQAGPGEVVISFQGPGDVIISI